MRVLALGAFHRAAAAALVVDGRPTAAALEEGFTRKLGDPSFPRRAARWCLERSGLEVAELDAVVFYEKPLRKFERTAASQLRSFPRSAKSFARGMFTWLGDRLWTRERIEEEFAIGRERTFFVPHAEAHAAAAYHGSPFSDAAVLVIDDVGEWTTTWLGHGEGAELRGLGSIGFPHSLGLMTSMVTQYLGFQPGADEALVESLALLGQPVHAERLAEIVPARERGGFEVRPELVRFAFDAEQLYDGRLEQLLGPARQPGSPLRAAAPDTRDADIAASWQRVLEERVLALARELHARSKSPRLCVGGMLATNLALVTRLANDGPFSEIHVPPDPDEAGAVLGAALVVAGSLGDDPRRARGASWCLGEGLDSRRAEGACELSDEPAARAELCRRLSAGERVGWVRGPLDFGGISLHGRLALAQATGEGARGALLSALQPGEEWRPCRLLAPADSASEWIEVHPALGPALQNGRARARASERLQREAPGAVDRDGSSWCQLVSRASDPELAALLESLRASGRPPLLLATDLALRGQPIAKSELDAVEIFRRSRLDALVCGTRLYARS